MKKLRFIILCVCLILIIIVIVIFGIGLVFNNVKAAFNEAHKNDFTIVLDCGHGGPDGGAVGADGTAEKDINLSLGIKLREILSVNGYNVVMTRNDDNFICDDHNASLREQNVSDLHNRLKIAEKYPNSIFLSLHMNKFSDAKYRGSQAFYGPKNAGSKGFAESLSDAVKMYIQPDNKRLCKEMDSSVYIIYNATHPAVLLECGFMSNEAELNNFKDKKYQSKYVYAVFCGIQNYLKKRGK